MKNVEAYKVPSDAQKIANAQALIAKTYKNRLVSTDKKLTSDLDTIFQNYDPAIHIVGVKATHGVKNSFKDMQSRTVQYIAGNVVKDPKKFDTAAVCGGGLHFSFGHDPGSMSATLSAKTERDNRFHIALIPVGDAVVVGGNKVKAPVVDVVFTGSFKDCYRLLNTLFGNLGTMTNIVVE